KAPATEQFLNAPAPGRGGPGEQSRRAAIAHLAARPREVTRDAQQVGADNRTPAEGQIGNSSRIVEVCGPATDHRGSNTRRAFQVQCSPAHIENRRKKIAAYIHRRTAD